jgi:hypothetical protein
MEKKDGVNECTFTKAECGEPPPGKKMGQKAAAGQREKSRAAVELGKVRNFPRAKAAKSTGRHKNKGALG